MQGMSERRWLIGSLSFVAVSLGLLLFNRPLNEASQLAAIIGAIGGLLSSVVAIWQFLTVGRRHDLRSDLVAYREEIAGLRSVIDHLWRASDAGRAATEIQALQDDRERQSRRVEELIAKNDRLTADRDDARRSSADEADQRRVIEQELTALRAHTDQLAARVADQSAEVSRIKGVSVGRFYASSGIVGRGLRAFDRWRAWRTVPADLRSFALVPRKDLEEAIRRSPPGSPGRMNFLQYHAETCARYRART